MADKVVEITRLNLEIDFVKELAIIDGFDSDGKRYSTTPDGDEAKTTLSALFKKVKSAFPGKNISLKVRGTKILPEE